MLCYKFLSRMASSVLRVNCYQRGFCVGGSSAFNSPFGHGSRSHNIRPLDNHLSGVSIRSQAWSAAEFKKETLKMVIDITIFKVFVDYKCRLQSINKYLPYYWIPRYLVVDSFDVAVCQKKKKKPGLL